MQMCILLYYWANKTMMMMIMMMNIEQHVPSAIAELSCFRETSAVVIVFGSLRFSYRYSG